jgi:hypothetical protein
MHKFLMCIALITTLGSMNLAHAIDDDDDWSRDGDEWKSKYGAKRVQIKRVKAETPSEIYELKRASAKSTYDAEQRRCKYKEGTGKQYCDRLAEEKFNEAISRLRAERESAESKH